MRFAKICFFVVAVVVVSLLSHQAFSKITPTDADVKSHVEMKKWLKEHPFEFRFPKFMDKFFAQKLVRDPTGFELPPGQLWPYPHEWWTMRPSWWFTYIWDWIVSLVKFTHYSSYLISYRIVNSGMGYVSTINPGAHIPWEAEMRRLETTGMKHTPEWRYQALMTSASLFHTAEDDGLLISTLHELCDETTLTPLKCDNPESRDVWKTMIRNLLMSSYLRLGENENCRENHSYESCLLPLKGLALHIRPSGSENAVKYLNIELEAHPDNLGAKWLLNVAHMTLGTYPHGMDEKHLIPPSAFESEYDIKVFPNVEELLGLDTFTSMGTGIMDDFIGEDGLKDIFQCSASFNRNVKMYKNLGNGKFEDVTEKAGLLGIDGGANCRQADYNNDG